MITKSGSDPRSFTAFSSASGEARHDAALADDAGAHSGRAGANATPDEITTLERRVLAHERILQALLGHLAEDDPEILVQLKARFGSGHNLGEYEQDFVSTDHYGDHFVRSIEAEVEHRRRRSDGSRLNPER